MKSGEQGSVFLETLVATAIVAMVLGAAFQVVADSATHHHKVDARRYALMIARARLAEVGSAVALGSGVVEGREGDDAWRIEMQPCGDGSSAGVLYCVAVTVKVAEGGPPLVTLTSRRLAPLA